MNEHDAITALGALAHESRLQVYRRLMQAGPSGISAGDLAEQIGVDRKSARQGTECGPRARL